MWATLDAVATPRSPTLSLVKWHAASGAAPRASILSIPFAGCDNAQVAQRSQAPSPYIATARRSSGKLPVPCSCKQWQALAAAHLYVDRSPQHAACTDNLAPAHELACEACPRAPLPPRQGCTARVPSRWCPALAG